MPAADSELIVIDWDRVRRHAGADADRGVNVRRHDDTGGLKALPEPAPAPTAEGAGDPP